jgi:hypothetical protein
MKKILSILGGIVLVIIVAVVLLLGSLDSIIKSQIETVGTELTGVTVTVDDVNIDLTDGAGEITGLTVANPDGYSSNPAFRLGTLKLGIDIGSLVKAQPIILDTLVIESMDTNLELRGNTSNLNRISESVSKNSDSAEEKTAETEEGKPLLLSISKLFINNVKITISDEEKTSTEKLPTIELSNIGGEEGASPAGIAGVILTKLVTEILKEAAAEQLMKKVNEAVDGATKSLLDTLNKALN